MEQPGAMRGNTKNMTVHVNSYDITRITQQHLLWEQYANTFMNNYTHLVNTLAVQLKIRIIGLLLHSHSNYNITRHHWMTVLIQEFKCVVEQQHA